MRRAGLQRLAALPHRVRRTNSRHGYPIALDRLGRNFEAAAPNLVRHHLVDEPKGRLLG